jgi:hypothetical protein
MGTRALFLVPHRDTYLACVSVSLSRPDLQDDDNVALNTISSFPSLKVVYSGKNDMRLDMVIAL